VRYLAIFPLSSSRVLSLSRYILSRLSLIMGSSVGGLTYLHIHLYLHMTNPTNRCSFPYLGQFYGHSCPVHAFELCCFLFCDLRYPSLCSLFTVSNTYVPCSDIYILHPKNFRDMKFMPLLVRIQHGFKTIRFNKKIVDVLL